MKMLTILKHFNQGKEFSVTLTNEFNHQVNTVDESGIRGLEFILERSKLHLWRFDNYYRIVWDYNNARFGDVVAFKDLCNQFKGTKGNKIVHSGVNGSYWLMIDNTLMCIDNCKLILTINLSGVLVTYSLITKKENYIPSEVKKSANCIGCKYHVNSQYLWCTVAPYGYGTNGCIRS